MARRRPLAGPGTIGRRRFLAGSVLLGLGGCRSSHETAPPATGPPPTPAASPPVPPATSTPPAWAPPPTAAEEAVWAAEPGVAPFALGVASGEPRPDGVLLWTRLLDGPGAAPHTDGDAVVGWAVARDPAMADVVATGEVVARAEDGHAVHVQVGGLDPGGTWHYRFELGSERRSPVGRTRTTAAPTATLSGAVVAVVCCQHYEKGYFRALADIAAAGPDLVVHLGDYIYASGVGDEGPRRHEGPSPQDVAGYRRRHELVRADPMLQAAHASAPWLVTWDDNDVAHGWATDHPRLAAAAQAFGEHLPVPAPGGLRRARLGDLLDVVVPDTRSHRDPPAGRDAGLFAGVVAVDEELARPDRTVLGAEQEDEVGRLLTGSDASWQLLGSSVMLSALALSFGSDVLVNPDQWDGYPAARGRLAAALASARAPLVVSGDLHAGVVSSVHDDRGEPVAAELVAPSATSTIDPLVLVGLELAARADPSIEYFDGERRGWLRLDVEPDHILATHRLVVDVTRADSPVEDGPSFLIPRGAREAAPA